MMQIQIIRDISKYILRLINLSKGVGWILLKSGKVHSMIIHKRFLAKINSHLVLHLICRKVKKKLTCPNELTIILIHNYEKPPIMEKSLHYVGIDNFVVLKPQIKGYWRQTIKLTMMYDYLKNNYCKTEYILFCDSYDAIIRDDPRLAIKCLQDQDCDLLMSASTFIGGYRYMTEAKIFADKIASKNGYPELYINTGVWIGKTNFWFEILSKAMQFVTENDITRKEYNSLLREKKLGIRLPEFPKGVGSDQEIMRYLFPYFYPQMKIDYQNRLAIR